MKILNKIRRKIAALVVPRTLWSRHTHWAYPEIHTDEGSWTIRWYTYEPIEWKFNGNKFKAEPPFDEPREQHPTMFPVGEAPAASVAAWNKYYAERPVPFFLVKVQTGIAKSKSDALAIARKEMRKTLETFLIRRTA